MSVCKTSFFGEFRSVLSWKELLQVISRCESTRRLESLLSGPWSALDKFFRWPSGPGEHSLPFVESLRLVFSSDALRYWAEPTLSNFSALPRQSVFLEMFPSAETTMWLGTRCNWAWFVGSARPALPRSLLWALAIRCTELVVLPPCWSLRPNCVSWAALSSLKEQQKSAWKPSVIRNKKNVNERRRQWGRDSSPSVGQVQTAPPHPLSQCSRPGTCRSTVGGCPIKATCKWYTQVGTRTGRKLVGIKIFIGWWKYGWKSILHTNFYNVIGFKIFRG